MLSLPYLCICIYCMLQIGFLWMMNQRRWKIHSRQAHYFSLIMLIMLISFSADIISSIKHVSQGMLPFVASGNFVEVILNTTLLLIYFKYVCAQIENIDLKWKRKITIFLWVLAVLCSVIVLSTAFTGKVFYFDKARIYHRGPLFWLPMSILFVMMLTIEVFIIKLKPKIEASYYRSLILFLIFPLIGSVFQSFIIGLPFSLISATFAAQVVFTNIQNHTMDTDYLTGVFNRQSLDMQMRYKIKNANENHSFSAILLDIDNFKVINDRFGHYEGDMVLIHTANILRNALSGQDIIARYGGDEFCVLFEEDTLLGLNAKITLINENLRKFNDATKKTYNLSFSIGYAIYNLDKGNDMESFFKTMDQRMYEEKISKKTENEKKEL